ncbi:Dna2-domain-containing protein [Exidia glandulosa HHB12029]|uniref:DNA replication ATP-dependent helicase/nuclease DNA2 n=1 Tax=Exidia glandulosa HHB12029 TaxID=1314781 RepID=A0A165BB44_EXIGL|nr:Dna2-domain-containing protein [Exidia glandulosa HHB12029]
MADSQHVKAEEDAFMRSLLAGMDAHPKRTPSAKRTMAPVDSFGGGSDMDWDAFDEWEQAQLAQPPKPKTLPTPSYSKEELTRCVVNSVADGGSIKNVTATVADSDEQVLITLCDDWTLTRVRTGDILNVLGTFHDTTPRRITLTAQNNTLVLHPDLLLTATSVSTSHRCARKPVLGLLLPGVGPDAAPAVAWGNMLHEVVQSCFTERDFTQPFIDARIEEAISASLSDITRMGLSKDNARAELQKRSAGLKGFATRFVADEPKSDAQVSELGASSTARDTLAITGVNAVEEDVWSPRYGLKGKVDASVQTAEWTQPFEIKTGRSIGGLEHRAQTMLYALMMAERYGLETPSGLLYYTQSPELIRVPARRNEVRGLMVSRNEMAAFVAARWRNNERRNAQPQDDETDGFLPPPIDDAHLCGKCFNVDSCMLYRRAVEKNAVDEADDVFELWLEKTNHLTDAQCAFFEQWERLISLEEAEMTRFRRELWTMSAREREVRGRAFADLVLAPTSTSASAHDDQSRRTRHTYSFARKPDAGAGAGDSMLSGHISRGDAVTVSVEPDLVAFARGFVVELRPDSITIGAEQPLPLEGRLLANRGGKDSVVFRIDKDELAGGIARIRDNLARLFYVDGEARLRRLVVDLEAPRFEELAEDDATIASQTGTSVVLNAHQEAAAKKVMAARDYALVLGMPGTGKTTTTAEIIRRFVKMGKSVLLTSYTHSAVDTILRTLGEVDFDILRLGNAEKVHPDVRKYTLEAREPARTVEEYERQIILPPVVATTCLSIDHALAPLVRSHRARKEGFDTSLFKRLCEAHPESVADLALQYRMNSDIMSLSNELVYGGRLKCGSEEVAARGLRRRGVWHSPVTTCLLTVPPEYSSKVLFLDTDGLPAFETRAADLVQNDVEVQLIRQMCDALVSRGVDESDIGVISLYRQQLKTLQHALTARPDIEVLTVDRSQGRDKACVLVSMVRSNEEHETGELLKDWRRINVALTRAKRKLVVVGSRSTLQKVDTLRRFFDLCDEHNWIVKLPKDAHLIHEPCPETTNRTKAVKRPAPIADGKENAAPVATKKAKVVGASGESILRTRPLLRDVVNAAM